MAEEATEVEEVRRVVATVDSLEAVEDPTERALLAGALLAEWPKQHTRLRQIRQEAVLALRAEKVSYRNIAKTLGISVARVQQIEAGTSGSKPKAGEAVE